jgi:hypothetical protein
LSCRRPRRSTDGTKLDAEAADPVDAMVAPTAAATKVAAAVVASHHRRVNIFMFMCCPLLWLAPEPRPREGAAVPCPFGCEQALLMLHVYVELVLDDAPEAGAPRRYPEAAAHFLACRPCAEDHQGLLAAARADWH